MLALLIAIKILTHVILSKITTLNYIVDIQALTLTTTQGESVKIRPKTCQLLIVLLKNQGKVVSKALLLEQVWNETVVDEQVVFQSIRELRQIFSGIEAIKTLPKQGYLWLPHANVKESHLLAKNTYKTSSHSAVYKACLIGILLVLILSYLGANNILSVNDKRLRSVNGSVIVLPTENLIKGNDHSWVRLGMMDQIIQRLPNNTHAGVLQTDYVLEVIKRANLTISQINEDSIPAIFNVSGAELIIATKLSGSPSDYQLAYSFYRRSAQQRGVLFNKEIEVLLDQLTRMIAEQIGDSQPLSGDQYIAEFNDALLGAALDLILEEKHDQAIPLLTGVVNGNPDNLTAQRLPVESYLRTKQYDLMAVRLAQGIAVARQLDDMNELIRLLYYEGVYYFVVGQTANSKASIAEGLELAATHNDWLFRAFLTELNAKLAINARQFASAE